MEDKFEMLFTPYRHSKTYRMQVEVIHRSEQVIRFRISGGEKFITMEKLLYKKTGSCKILDSNFALNEQSVEQTAYTIFEIQNRLDAYLKKDDDKPAGNPKWEH